jgi:xanthine/uracil permease
MQEWNTLNQSQSIQKTTLETLQWFIFLLASTIALPIVIGSLYDMSVHEISGLMQRTFFVVGIACFLQGLVGHKLPIVDGPAGIWISIFTVYAVTTVQHGGNLKETLRILETGMLLTGLFLIIIGVLRLSQRIVIYFTPLVTGSFLFMLTLQLSGTFLRGMLGLNGQSNVANLSATLIAFFVFFFILGFSTFWKGPLKNYAVLIGIGAGWLFDWAIHGIKLSNEAMPSIQIPEVFAWGLPKWDLGVIPIAFLTAVILLSNLVASLGAGSFAIKGDSTFEYSQMNKGSLTLGINQGLSAVFSSVGVVTLASSSGFIQLTGQKRRRPFLYASLLLAIIALFPPVVAFISLIPAPVANAALLATFVQLMGIGLRNIASQKLTQRRLTILGVSFLIGVGLMFMPQEAFQQVPSIVQNLISNGLLVGTILIIVLEQLWKESEEEKA